jgi:hypothetical protein
LPIRMQLQSKDRGRQFVSVIMPWILNKYDNDRPLYREWGKV